MGSENAKKVALDVIDSVCKGKIANKVKIQQKNGYTEKSARASKAIRTKTYQKTIKPFLDRMITHRDKIQLAMDGKDLTKEQYKVLSDAMSKFNHDIQLLGGGDTERFTNVVDLPADVKTKLDKFLTTIKK